MTDDDLRFTLFSNDPQVRSVASLAPAFLRYIDSPVGLP